MYYLNPRLAAQVFDGEYIIANLDTGLYYNLQGIAVSFVDALPSQDALAVIEHLSSSFPEHAEGIKKELSTLLNDLLTEEIVLKNDLLLDTASGLGALPEAYVPARFNRYADMQDLLLLDPIHDVDEEGWTVQPEKN